MNRSLAASVALVLIVVTGIAFAFVTGVGPAPGSSDDGTDGEFPTETPTPGDPGTGADETTEDGSGEDTTAAPEFAVSVTSVEECGTTCRDVTVALSNEGGNATNVTVHSRVFVGQGTDGDVVWSGTYQVGALQAGEVHTTTERVSLSYSEGYEIRQADGWITIQTTIDSDERTVTFTEQRQVD